MKHIHSSANVVSKDFSWFNARCKIMIHFQTKQCFSFFSHLFLIFIIVETKQQFIKLRISKQDSMLALIDPAVQNSILEQVGFCNFPYI